jgi:hypothetical protein
MTKDEKIKTGFVLLLIICVAFLPYFVDTSSDNAEEQSNGQFTKAYEALKESQKMAFLKDVKNTACKRAWTIEGVVEHYVKKQFQYPEEVTFPDEYATKVEHMRIRNVSTGEVIFKGEAIGKNAYGVKQRMQYYVILEIGPQDSDMKYVDAGLNNL